MSERSEEDDGSDVSGERRARERTPGERRIQFDPDAGSGAIHDDAVTVLSTSERERGAE